MKRRLILIVLLLILAELVARVYIATQPAGLYIAFDIVPQGLVRESQQSPHVWDDRGFWVDGRETIPRSEARHSLYMVGTSIFFGQFVPASETIASHLQRRLPAYRVVNLGAHGQPAISMFHQVKTLPLRPGDVVVMEGLTMDAYSVYNLQAQAQGRCAGLAIVQLLCQPRPYDAMNNGAALETLFALRSTRDYTRSHGATFLYVIVPYFYSVNPQTQRERTIDAQSAGNITAVYRSAWTAIYNQLAGESGVLDLSRALDGGRAAGRDYFFDIWHFDASGNEIVAQALYAALFGPF
jgi:hypothetical protein